MNTVLSRRYNSCLISQVQDVFWKISGEIDGKTHVLRLPEPLFFVFKGLASSFFWFLRLHREQSFAQSLCIYLLETD